eukprot:10989546-Ditylum_brightwellii.AAC.1
MAAIKDLVEHCHVVVAWEDGMDSLITGIKDHGMRLPAEIMQMIMSELKSYLENKGIGGGELIEAQ